MSVRTASCLAIWTRCDADTVMRLPSLSVFCVGSSCVLPSRMDAGSDVGALTMARKARPLRADTSARTVPSDTGTAIWRRLSAIEASVIHVPGRSRLAPSEGTAKLVVPLSRAWRELSSDRPLRTRRKMPPTTMRTTAAEMPAMSATFEPGRRLSATAGR